MNKMYVHNSGVQTLVVGPSSYEFMEFGVPIGGPMDQHSANFAKQLAGISEEMPLIEMCLIGAEFSFEEDTIIAITGAEMNPTINGVTIQINAVLTLAKDSILKFDRAGVGCRTYLAVKGLLPISVSGFTLFPLRKGDLIEIGEPKYKSELADFRAIDHSSSTIKMIKGPEYDYFDEEVLNQILSKPLQIEPQSNRMAYVLQAGLENQSTSIFRSSGVIPGTVQLTPSGQLNILMRDCQTTGGYPRIGVLDEDSINCLAQKKPGEFIKFSWSI